MKVILYTVATI